MTRSQFPDAFKDSADDGERITDSHARAILRADRLEQLVKRMVERFKSEVYNLHEDEALRLFLVEEGFLP
jgi:hypothetical protein